MALAYRRMATRILAVVLFATLAHCGGSSRSTYDDSPPPPPDIPNTKAYPAPSNLTCSTGSALTYSSFGSSFLLKYCRSCHSSSVVGVDRRGATVASNFDSAVDAQVWRSAILGRISGGKKMPPAGDIDAQDLKAAKDWLGCGAPRAPE
jgi:cytochrome c5